MVTEERVTLDTVEINRPVDPKVFTLAGMDIPVGAAYHAPGDDRVQFWDGAKVVSQSPFAGRQTEVRPAAPPVPVEPPTGRRWLGLVGVFLFSAAGVLLFRRVIRR